MCVEDKGSCCNAELLFEKTAICVIRCSRGSLKTGKYVSFQNALGGKKLAAKATDSFETFALIFLFDVLLPLVDKFVAEWLHPNHPKTSPTFPNAEIVAKQFMN